jgi:DNA-binding transcriptional ArsR family regulator
MYPPSDPFSPDNLRLNPNGVVSEVKVELPSVRARRERRFFPALSEPLFARLIALPGKSLGVYLILLQRSRIEKSNPVTLTSTYLSRFGLTRQDKRRALSVLEGAGLIRVEKRGRKNPLVWLCEEPP